MHVYISCESCVSASIYQIYISNRFHYHVITAAGPPRASGCRVRAVPRCKPSSPGPPNRSLQTTGCLFHHKNQRTNININ